MILLEYFGLSLKPYWEESIEYGYLERLKVKIAGKAFNFPQSNQEGER